MTENSHKSADAAIQSTQNSAEMRDVASGFTASLSPQHSPNLAKWLAKNADTAYRRAYGGPKVYDSPDGPWIGWIEDETWFIGSRLWRVLCAGKKAECGCWPLKLDSLVERAGFWDRYFKIGRCEIDQGHSRCFVGDESRWNVEGDVRHCKWCGAVTQHLERWQETVERQKWITTP